MMSNIIIIKNSRKNSGTSPIESLQVETGEPSLETRRLKLSLQYYMKMKANPENPAYSCVVNPEYKRLFTLMTFCKVNGTSMSPANCSKYNQSLSDLLHQWNAEEMMLSYAGPELAMPISQTAIY